MEKENTCRDCKHSEDRDFENRVQYASNCGLFCLKARMRVGSVQKAPRCFEAKEKA